MTAVVGASAPQSYRPHAETRPPDRDASMDAVRAVCLLTVVGLHALMVGVERDSDGGLLTSVAMSGADWFVPVTWVLQVMPLFFIAGGFASLSQWRRMQIRGRSWRDYLAGRIRRLTIPTGLLVLAVAGALAGASAAGADPDLIAEVSLRIGQPLWFLVVYLAVTSLVPVMAWLHDRAPGSTLAVLGLGVVTVDVLRLSLETPSLGLINMALVWLLIHQLGFFFHDGTAAAWPRSRLLTGAAVSLTGLGVLAATELYSADLLENLNPPTVMLVLMGITHFFLLRLAKPRLDALLTRRGPAALAQNANPVAMTVYLWHMPVMLVIVALLNMVAVPFPPPHSGLWWLTRLPWLVIVFGAVMLAARPLIRLESWAMRLPRLDRVLPARRAALRPALRSGIAVGSGVVGIAVVLLHGFAAPVALISVTLLLASIVLADNGITRTDQTLSVGSSSEERKLR